MLRSSHRSGELFADPSTPPVWSRSSSSRKAGEEYASMGELSPGLLDLHSFDTELLPDVRMFPSVLIVFESVNVHCSGWRY